MICPEICIWVIPELTTTLKETQIPGTPERNIETENIVSNTLCILHHLGITKTYNTDIITFLAL